MTHPRAAHYVASSQPALGFLHGSCKDPNGQAGRICLRTPLWTFPPQLTRIPTDKYSVVSSNHRPQITAVVPCLEGTRQPCYGCLIPSGLSIMAQAIVCPYQKQTPL